MSKENGFAPIRRGLWEHIRDGRMSHLGALAFVYACSQADTRTGIWKGSAGALVGELGIKPRTARDLLERLEHGDYIRRFATAGSHVCYAILIHKFPITQGEHNGEQLDAINSLSSAELRYLPKETREHDGEVHGEVRASQRIKEKEEKRKKAAAPPADPRRGPFLEFAKSCFEAKHEHPPTWDFFGKDGTALAAFLRRAHHVTLETWQTHVLNFMNSTEAFTVKQGGSLSYFISKFDAFASGPILEGGSNGNLRSFAEQRSQKTADAIQSVIGRFEEAPGGIRRALPTTHN